MEKIKIEKKLDVLFVHPSISPKDNYVPMGLIGLMNSLDCNKKGIFLKSISKKQIKNCKIIIMDLHWYYQIYMVNILSNLIKKINPEIKIILGGYTSTILAESLIEKLNIDYIIKGDAEKSFPILINSILNKKNNIKNIPNLISKEFKSKKKYVLNKKDYNHNNCLNIDWFNDLKDVSIRFQKECVKYKKVKRDPLYPFIPIFKGCKYNCEWCYGSKSLQKKICGRGLIVRDPKYIVRDIEYCEENKWINCIYIIADFIDVLKKNSIKKINRLKSF